jgi:hypothetical protein
VSSRTTDDDDDDDDDNNNDDDNDDDDEHHDYAKSSLERSGCTQDSRVGPGRIQRVMMHERNWGIVVAVFQSSSLISPKGIPHTHRPHATAPP